MTYKRPASNSIMLNGSQDAQRVCDGGVLPTGDPSHKRRASSTARDIDPRMPRGGSAQSLSHTPPLFDGFGIDQRSVGLALRLPAHSELFWVPRMVCLSQTTYLT